MKSYSQNHEDLIIYGYFNGFKGTLLDIGANNGIDMSNSRLFIENGWKGLLVEPSPAFAKLAELYQEHPLVRMACCAISNSDGVVNWYECADSLLSTLHKQNIGVQDSRFTKTAVKCRTYKTLLHDFKCDRFDYITIDAESEDWIILQQIDLSGTRCLCIEYGKYMNEIVDYCSGYGMKPLSQNGENIIFTR